MTAKLLSLRPDMVALCFLGSRLPVHSLLLRTSSIITPTSICSLSIAPSLPTAKLPFSASSWPISRTFCIRATTDPDNSVSAESALMESMRKKIKERLSADSVVVKDAYGDGRHVSIEVVSSAFEGQSAVNRQRMVYKAIWEELEDRVHAVDQMSTKTPSEAAASGK